MGQNIKGILNYEKDEALKVSRLHKTLKNYFLIVTNKSHKVHLKTLHFEEPNFMLELTIKTFDKQLFKSLKELEKL